ncbi:MAG: sodium:proton antiporter [Opitutales bacterium]|nr:sodium:proton antiporter [Opitutales bacterium]
MNSLGVLNCLAVAEPSKYEAVQLWMSVPFVLLLALIAVMPLTGKKLKHLWERFYPVVAIGLGLVVSAYYIGLVPGGAGDVGHSLKEYISFIALVGSLFVISGGIEIKLAGNATPKTNTVFLLVGALLANFIGTTGASMVLIRPWMQMNRERLSAFHIVFFIFIVSNVGGALTPIGDPPLYIGYLRGVEFFWIFEQANLPWLFVVGALLAVFFLIDLRNFRKAGPQIAVAEKTSKSMTFSLRGIKNIGYLLVVVGAVLLPGQVPVHVREVLETYFVREIVMLLAAIASYFQTPSEIHAQNHFNFEPIREVGYLFIGIFLTMVPALAYLTTHGSQIAETLTTPAHYYYASGALSGFLDNTPTYANFFDLIRSIVPEDVPADKQVSWMTNPENSGYNLLVVAISLGSVFFGALTYIGNGPNFMVKSIAETEKVKMPTFFGYVFRFSLPVLVPVLVLCGWIFLS